MKKYMYVLLLSILGWTVQANLTHAKDNTILHSTPVLKVNDYVVAFTYPKPPYIDEHQRLMVPLRAVAEILGAKVSYDPARKSASLSRGQSNLNVTIGSSRAFFNEQEKGMDTVPVVSEGAVFVPLRWITESLQLKLNHHNLGVVTVIDPQALKAGRFFYLSDDDRFGIQRLSNPYVFQISDFTVSPATLSAFSSSQGYEYAQSLQFKAKNITGHDLPQGAADFHMIISNSSDGVFFNDTEMTSVDIKDKVRPAIQKGGLLRADTQFTVQFKKSNSLSFVLVAPRSLKVTP
ncbi:hypothetical protein J2Z69_001237 [Paenibacillus shirakamiensis]|uniref:Copper amine oxidase-like N-terminal domain-containing protein n=1 Tax=Paenibacillus shirakamiensis TaxID=1265935 RepID=A0ABS4JEU0_9BACL|nr:copper amine oxidase N-terminal domain-containing protein [Paenibacillus shirakamiensis]MBP2000218.1 hypothetical protein [Paenibacillus shirakamiensis]